MIKNHSSAPSPQLSSHGAVICFLVAILMPSVDYYYYYSVIAIMAVGVVVKRPPLRNELSTWFITLSLFFVIATPKLVSYSSLSDVKEFGKVLVFLTTSLILNIKFDKKKLTRLFFVVLVVDMVFTLVQWFKFDLAVFNLIDQQIHKQHHIEGSLSLNSVRALGVFSDTAEHAAVCLILYLFFLSGLRYSFEPKKSILGLLFCVIIIVLTQSKTGVIVLVLSIPILCLNLVRSKADLRSKAIVVTAFFFVMFYFDNGVNVFEQYQYLLQDGLSISSVGERQSIWQNVAAVALNSSPVLLLFGMGRGALELNNVQASVFDNDLIYVLNTFGLFGVLFYIIIVPVSIIYYLRVNGWSSRWLSYCLIFMTVMGFTTDMISSLKVITIIGLILAMNLRRESDFANR